MTESLDGKRVVITGANGGIGTAAAQALRRAGATVRGIDLVAGPDVEIGDVTDAASISAAIDRIAADLGGIDVLVNNAGIGRPVDAGDFPGPTARQVMDVNFFGVWNTTAAAMPHLLASRGHIVNVSSGLSLVDLPFAAAYSASKRAVDAYSAALRLEYGDRVSVTTLHPGYIRTAIHAEATAAGASLEGMARADTVEGAAAAILRACVRRPRALTTSVASTVELWLARRFPRTTSRVIARRARRWREGNATPSFLRFPG